MWERKEIQEVLRRAVPKLISAAIILFWLVMTGLLIHREVLVPRLPGRPGPAYPDVPTDTWMAVLLPEGDPVGFIHMRTEPEAMGGEEGTRYYLTTSLQVTFLGEQTPITLTGTAWAAHKRGLAELKFRMSSKGHAVRLTGQIADGTLYGAVHTVGESFPIELPVGEDVVLWGGTGAGLLSVPVVAEGEEYVVDTFDPVTLSLGRARITGLGREELDICGETVFTRVMDLEVRGVTTRAWILDSGEVVRAETPFGFVIEKTTGARAAQVSAPDAAPSLIELAAVPAQGKTPFRGAGRMLIRLTGVAPGVQPPGDDTQTSPEPGLLVVQQPPGPPGDEEHTHERGLGAHLAGDPLIQVDHPKIRLTAARIAPSRLTPWERAQCVNQWVYESIAKTPVVSIPSALDVLDTREGDCNEHTVLFAALARAAGVPTRIAVGLVWSEELGSFYYHAWPEVYVGRWIWMDPTFGEPIADATHIKLVTGNIQRWTELLPYLGQVRMEVLEIE